MPRFVMALVFLALPTVIGSSFFLLAGRANLPMVWGVLGLLVAFTFLVVWRIDRALIRERVSPGPGNRDRLTRPAMLLLLLAHWVLTALDVGRFQWSPIPWPVQLAGLVGYAISLGGVYWAMQANPFYSSVVRLQSDRGQHPVTAGPYRFVRHPGYTATILANVFGGLAFGSWVGMLPLVGVVVLFLRRTLVEDRMLATGLAGYVDYTRRVPYRLVAGVF